MPVQAAQCLIVLTDYKFPLLRLYKGCLATGFNISPSTLDAVVII